jgi:hypothetical protein
MLNYKGTWPPEHTDTVAFLSQFKIGDEFILSEEVRWRVTDVGSRTLIAIDISKGDTINYSGPPYHVSEVAFDEYDFPAIVKVETLG